MGILAQWHDDVQRIILLDLDGQWSFSELEAAILQVDALITSVPHQVDILIDIVGSHIPSDVMGMAKALLSQGEARANEGRRVVVGMNAALKGAYKLVSTLFARQLKGRELLFASDRETAIALLSDLRDTTA